MLIVSEQMWVSLRLRQKRLFGLLGGRDAYLHQFHVRE
jgi:hypothetical protein